MTQSVGNFYNKLDMLYIFSGVLVAEILVLIYCRYILSSKSIKKWYDYFGLNAVIADVSSVLVGFFLARFIITKFFPKYRDNLWLLLIILLLVQIIHDILFYILFIKPIRSGHNTMIDVYKNYAKEHGGKIVIVDSIIMITSLLLSLVIKNYMPEYSLEIIILSIYTIIYFIYKN